MTSKRSVTHGCNSICQHSESIAPCWLRKAGFTLPLHLWMNAWKKIQKPEVMWWNCPWEAAGVMVAPHTVAAMKAKARTREAVCPVKTSINWFVCYFCLFPIAESRDSPWMCTWSHPFLPLLGAETMKSSRCLVTCTSAGLCLSKALTRALNQCGQEGEGPYVSPTS